MLLVKFYLLFQSVENPASYQAEKISRLFHTFNIAAAGMLLLVSFLVAYICIKFRQKRAIILSQNKQKAATSWKL